MFCCEISGELSEKGESPVFVVIKKRRKDYFGIKPRKKYGKPSSPGRDSFSSPAPIEKIGEGWEIVKELRVRKSVLDRLTSDGKEIKCEWEEQKRQSYRTY